MNHLDSGVVTTECKGSRFGVQDKWGSKKRFLKQNRERKKTPERCRDWYGGVKGTRVRERRREGRKTQGVAEAGVNRIRFFS